MKMIKILACYNPGKALSYPLRIDKQGRVHLHTAFLKQRGLDNIKYAVPFISEDSKQIEMILSPHEIEPDNFKLNRNASHGNDLSFQSRPLQKILKNNTLIYYQFRNLTEDIQYNDKNVTKIKFTRENGSTASSPADRTARINSARGGSKASDQKVKDEVDHEIAKEQKHRGRPRKKLPGQAPVLNPVPIPSSDKKTSAVNNTDFPTVRGRQPWIRCIGCGTFRKKFKPGMYWELVNEEYHIGVCSNCGGSDMKLEKYHSKIKEPEAQENKPPA